jgi:heme-degrading monooxygenase HmoA
MKAKGYVVLFTNQLAEKDSLPYHEFATELHKEVTEQPRFLGMESYRNPEGTGITISYWESKDAIAHWKKHSLHQAAQHFGKEKAYAWYKLRVCAIEREYHFTKSV